MSLLIVMCWNLYLSRHTNYAILLKLIALSRISNKQRMHSSRMRTVRCNSRLCQGGCLPGGEFRLPGGVGCLIRGDVCLEGCLPGGVSVQGVSAWGCLPWGVCLGMSAQGGACLGGCTPLLWTEFLTQACENITFMQLLL